MQTKLPTVLRSNCGTFAGYRKHQYHKEESCIPCHDAYLVYKKEWAKNNKDSKKASDKKYYETHKEQAKQYSQINKERISLRNKEYRLKNLEKRTQQFKEWYKENKKHNSLRKKEWVKNNPDKVERQLSRRRARRLGNGAEPYAVQEVLNLYGTDCHICNLPIDFSAPRHPRTPGWEQGLHIDHVIPISQGGPDTIDNVRPSHAICNMQKGAKMSEEFEQEIDPSLFDAEDVNLDEDDFDEDALDEDELEDWDEEDASEEEE